MKYKLDYLVQTVFLLLFAWTGFCFGRSYELKQPKDPDIVKIENEMLKIKLDTEFHKGVNQELKRCNEILKAWR